MKTRECRNLRCSATAVATVTEKRSKGNGHKPDREMWDGAFCLEHLQAAVGTKFRSLDRNNYLEVRKL